MTYVWRLVFLLVKFLVITNIVDPGYSRSRDPHDDHRNILMALHVAIQVIVTICLLRCHAWWQFAIILAIEGSLLVGTTLLERFAKVPQALKAYFVAEIVMVAGYAVLVFVIHT
jgi:hypothetical protein